MKIEAIIEEHVHHFLREVSVEYNGEKEAGIIIRQYISEGKITDEQERVLKTQLMDTLKILGIGVPFVLIPGASVLMPILIRVADRYNITLMPSAFTSQEGDGEQAGNKKR